MVTGDLWPGFLYPHARYDKKDVEKGLFQSAILLKVSLTFLLWGVGLLFSDIQIPHDFSDFCPEH